MVREGAGPASGEALFLKVVRKPFRGEADGFRNHGDGFVGVTVAKT